MDDYDYGDEPMCLNCGDYGCEYCGAADEGDDGQPSEYEEWQDVFGGDDDYDCSMNGYDYEDYDVYGDMEF